MFSTILYIVAAALLWAYILTWRQRERKAGALLLNLGRLRGRWLSNIIGAVGIIAPAVVLPLVLVRDSSTMLNWFPWSLTFLSLGVYWLLCGMSSLQVRENGILDFSGLLKWQSIETFDWDQTNLIVHIKRRPHRMLYVIPLQFFLPPFYLFAVNPLRIPLQRNVRREADAILAKYTQALSAEARLQTAQRNRQLTLISGCVLILSLLIFFGVGFAYLLLFKIPSPINHYLVDASTPLKPFDDPALDFTMSYPETWLVTSTPQGSHGDRTVKAVMTPFVTIKSSSKADDVSIEKIVADQQQLSVGPKGFQILSESSEQVDGLATHLTEYSYARMNQTNGKSEENHSLAVSFISKGKYYVITFDTSADTYSEVKDVFKRMIPSIKFR